MARDRSASSRPRELPARPWWTSPLLPLVLTGAGAVLCCLDGWHPYETFLRKRRWKPVEGQLVQPYQRRQIVNPTAERSSAREYLERRPQKRVFQETVEEGWPIKRRKLRWRVRLNYTYPWKNTRLTRMSDGPPWTFASKEEAEAYLRRVLRGTALRVWVDPSAPERATAFLEYRQIWHVRVGLTATGIGLLWLLVAVILGRSHARKEQEALAQAEGGAKKNRENP